MSSNLKAQLKALLAAKEYRAAIVLLESSNLPDKDTYIERIQARMAAEEESPDDKLKRLIAASDYGQARDLLQKIDHPKKAVMLAELERRITGEKPAAVSKPKSSAESRRILWYVLLVVVIGLVGAFGIMLRNNFRNNDLYASLYSVCREVFREAYYDGAFTANQFIEGCFTVTDETMTRYPQEVNYCYDNQNQTDALFMTCLADNNVKMYATALLNAPEE